MPQTVATQPHFAELNALVGQTVRVGAAFQSPHVDVLSIWTAENGNEGWLVGVAPGTPLWQSGGRSYTLFSGEIVTAVSGHDIILRN